MGHSWSKKSDPDYIEPAGSGLVQRQMDQVRKKGPTNYILPVGSSPRTDESCQRTDESGPVQKVTYVLHWANGVESGPKTDGSV